MAQIREIKKRIKSITSTKKVTHAMELVAASKMRKAQSSALSGRPYSLSLNQIIEKIRQKTGEISHEFLKTRATQGEMIILVTSDRGLAGGLNLNLFREILRALPFGKQETIKHISFITVGKKATAFAAKTQSQIVASFESEEKNPLDLARTITKIATDSFLRKEVSKVSIVYPHFESIVKQTPTWVTILPIELETEPTDRLPASPARSDSESRRARRGEPTYPLRPRLTSTQARSEASQPTILLFEPNTQDILKTLLPHYVLTKIYQILLEAKASEHSARMLAMKNATDAAGDLIEDLTLTYNQVRQEAITKELLDIVTAQKAFE